MLVRHIKKISPFLLIILGAVLVGIFYSNYPERVPLYFNWTSKDSDGYGDKNLAWLSPVIHFIIAVLLLKIIQAQKQMSIKSPNSYLIIQMLQKLNILNGLICFLTSVILTADLFLNFREARTLHQPLMAVLIFLVIGYYLLRVLRTK